MSNKLQPIEDTEILSSTRIFPESRPEIPVPHKVSLSIMDATVADFASSSATWMYDPPKYQSKAFSMNMLTSSLEKTLDAYPQWAGQLQWAPYNPKGDHTERLGRLILSYGESTDPGVALVIARSSKALLSIIPSKEDRMANGGCYNAKELSKLNVMTKTVPLVLHNRADFAGLPGLIVQITTFADGAVTLAVKFAHPLADAQTMINFVRDWAAVNTALACQTPLPTLSPVFDPSLLDNAAAGDIDAPEPDQKIIEMARSLPLHFFDWWASTDGCPPSMSAATQIPPELNPATLEPLGRPIPWSTWDFSLPVAHYLLYFSGQEVHSMWEEASAEVAPVSISHLDALVSHLWGLINRARGFKEDTENVNLDVTFGFRERLNPPLPKRFIGSPITLTGVTMNGIESSAESLGKRASKIRSTLSKFNPTTMPALIHHYVHQKYAQRYWNTFLGKRHVLFTSWHRQDIYGINFGAGSTARYIETVMPNMDGCLQIMEAGGSFKEDIISQHTAGDWYDEGVSVTLHIASDAMEKLLKDPLLRKYKKD